LREKLIRPSAIEDALIKHGVANESGCGAEFVEAWRWRCQARGTPVEIRSEGLGDASARPRHRRAVQGDRRGVADAHQRGAQEGQGALIVAGRHPDMRIVVTDDFEKLADRLGGTQRVMRESAKLAGRKG
jgi:hypothetical protein